MQALLAIHVILDHNSCAFAQFMTEGQIIRTFLAFAHILDYFSYILYNKTMRKLSVAGYGFFERLGPEQSLRLVRSAGFDAIDYPLYDEGKRLFFDLGGGRTNLSFAKEMRALAEDLGIVVGQTHAPFGYREDDGSTKDGVLDVYKRAAEATAALGAKHMVVHPIKFENCRFDFRREECFQLYLVVSIVNFKLVLVANIQFRNK